MHAWMIKCLNLKATDTAVLVIKIFIMNKIQMNDVNGVWMKKKERENKTKPAVIIMLNVCACVYTERYRYKTFQQQQKDN